MEYDLLLVTFSDGSIMVGQKYNTAFTSWAFRINEQKRLDIVDTLLTNNEELTKILNKNKSII